jgi:hypothetical protein
MPYTAPTVNYSATNNGTYTTITGVQSVSISRGRQRFQDPFPQSSCVVELIPANSYALPFAIGQYIDVRASNTTNTDCYFQGRITDVERQYDMPYNSSSGAAPGDRIRITATGGTGVLGSNQLVNYSFPSQNASYTIDNLCFDADVDNFGIEPIVGSPDGTPILSAQTFSGSALDLMNVILRSIVGSIDDVANRASTKLGVAPQNIPGDTLFIFSDTGAINTLKFNNLQFLSSVQNTFNEVNVEAAGIATQSATGTPPLNSLNYSTFNSTTAQSFNQANYLYNMLSGQVQACPYVIGVSDATENGVVELVTRMFNVEQTFGRRILQSSTRITFRGITSEGIIQGISTVFYQDNATAQIFLSPSLGQPFTLDSSAFGVLDTNRLGYP